MQNNAGTAGERHPGNKKMYMMADGASGVIVVLLCIIITTVVLVIDGKHAVWANTGDSRLYYIHRGELFSVTEDHSVAYKKFKAGEIAREAIAADEDQSSLLRTLGNEERYEQDVYESGTSLEQGDAFLLCSDGAWEYLSDYEALVDYHKAADASHWTELMLIRIICL